jgi:hypothetical protein
MKLKYTNDSGLKVNLGRRLGNACAASCRRFLDQITEVKETIFAESFPALKSQEHLLRLALNEAEAAAWLTGYPHLIFPALATEKVQGLIAWEARQQYVRRASPAFAVAA